MYLYIFPAKTNVFVYLGYNYIRIRGKNIRITISYWNSFLECYKTLNLVTKHRSTITTYVINIHRIYKHYWAKHLTALLYIIKWFAQREVDVFSRKFRDWFDADRQFSHTANCPGAPAPPPHPPLYINQLGSKPFEASSLLLRPNSGINWLQPNLLADSAMLSEILQPPIYLQTNYTIKLIMLNHSKYWKWPYHSAATCSKNIGDLRICKRSNVTFFA